MPVKYQVGTLDSQAFTIAFTGQNVLTLNMIGKRSCQIYLIHERKRCFLTIGNASSAVVGQGNLYYWPICLFMFHALYKAVFNQKSSPSRMCYGAVSLLYCYERVRFPSFNWPVEKDTRWFMFWRLSQLPLNVTKEQNINVTEEEKKPQTESNSWHTCCLFSLSWQASTSSELFHALNSFILNSVRTLFCPHFVDTENKNLAPFLKISCRRAVAVLASD